MTRPCTGSRPSRARSIRGSRRRFPTPRSQAYTRSGSSRKGRAWCLLLCARSRYCEQRRLAAANHAETSIMAKIVLGMAASHGPLLATPPEQWDQRVEADRRNPALVYRDGTFKFDDLAKLRSKEN